MESTDVHKELLRLQESSQFYTETDKNTETPWKSSVILSLLRERRDQKEPLRVAFLDIDSTMTGNPEVAVKVRDELDRLGYATVFVSSRTEEMLMSREEYEKSKALGFSRPEPKLLKDAEGVMQLAFADELKPQKGLYDPDIIVGSTGSNILIRQQDGGFIEDKDYKQKFDREPGRWRDKTKEILRMIDPEERLFRLMPVDTPGNYEVGKVDVKAPEYRIQLEMVTPLEPFHFENTGSTDTVGLPNKDVRQEGVNHKREFMERLEKLRKDDSLPEDIRKHLVNIRVTDDSNPERGFYSVWLTPNRAWKAMAVQYIVDQVENSLQIDPNELETFLAGDSFPDLGMGFLAGLGTKGEFLVVGGSRLTDVLSNEDQAHFAGNKLEAYKNRMVPLENHEGIYKFRVPKGVDTLDNEARNKGEMEMERTIVLGDLAYPGTRGPETILKDLEARE